MKCVDCRDLHYIILQKFSINIRKCIGQKHLLKVIKCLKKCTSPPPQKIKKFKVIVEKSSNEAEIIAVQNRL